MTAGEQALGVVQTEKRPAFMSISQRVTDSPILGGISGGLGHRRLVVREPAQKGCLYKSEVGDLRGQFLEPTLPI